MRRPAHRLSFLAAAAVVLVMITATIAFNLFIGWKVETDAKADLEYALSLDGKSNDAATTGRTPNYLMLDANYEVDDAESRLDMRTEKALASWFAKNNATYEIRRVVLDDWSCYAILCPYDDYYFDYETPSEDVWQGDGRHWTDPTYFVAYIDTTGEYALVASVDAAFFIIGVLGASLAAVAGYVAGRRIEESQEAQKRFYENMSHELKTPLAAIRGYAEGVRSGVMEAEPASQAIVRETTKMTSAIDEILSLSRLEAKTVELHREELDVADFVQDCMMPFEGVVRSRGLDVELELLAGTIQADPDLFEHALSNVLSNACRHAASELRVTYDGRELVVYNDGEVPSADELAHIFDRFYVGEGGSTGLGLAIAHEIAAMHGFSLTARTESNGLAMVFALGGD